MARGIPIPQETIAKAREMRAAGDKTIVIARAFSVSDAWVSKVCKGINPGQRSRFDHLNKIDVPALIGEMAASGATDREIASHLGVSGGFVGFLRRKAFGQKPRSNLHAEEVATLLLKGTPARVISDTHGISVSTVRVIASKRGITLPPAQPAPKGARPLLRLLPDLDRCFSYDPDTGVILKNGAKIGSVIRGYHKISIKGRQYLAHRLAWVMYFREEPPAVIDHADADPLNNRIANLRRADWHGNAFNRKLDKRNTTGVKGVYRMKDGRYRATVQAYGDVCSFESKDLDDARKTRQRLAEQMHGEFVRHG